MPSLTIEFANEDAAKHFGTWLCEAGEQDYWQWMECREQEEDGDITAIQFEYHHPQNEKFARTDKRRYENAKFLNGLVIKTKCGRLA